MPDVFDLHGKKLYYLPFMSQQLAIDGFAFAREGGVLEGTLPVSALLRLHDVLTEASGEVYYRVEGCQGEHGQAQLRVQVSGEVPLACQRCLSAVPFVLDIDSLLELVDFCASRAY